MRSNKKNYRLLIQKLHSIGYLRFTQSPKAHAGMFFVHKSDKKKIRLIVDARPANQIFRSPPSVQLCTSEGFARIEVEVPSHIRPGTADFKAHLEARGLFFGLADVKDCFHRMRQPLWLSKYFCWDPIPVSWIKGLQGTVLEGKKLTSHDYVHPMPASLCMGFSWSLYFAQLANETLMSKIPSLVGSQLVSDKGPPIVFGPEASEQIRHYVYVDNLGIISPHEALVKKSLDELGPGFDDRGLVLHPGEIQHEHIQALGCSMRGDIMATRVSPSRFVRLRQAIGGVLQRKKVSGRLIEIVLGHVTFCCLCNRQLLSIFSAIYKFIRRNYFAPTKLWDSVRRELWAFRSLMIYLHSDWWRPWNPLVSSSDASLEGYGISTSFWKPSDVAACGRRLERSRFKKAASTAARDHALTSAGFVKDDLTESWRRQEITSEELLEASGWEISDDFVEIPGRLLAKPLWEPKLWGRWGYEAGILELEGRALVKSLRRIALSPYGTDIRQLLLVDNMSVALAFDRFRSRNYRLLKQIRKFSSYLLSRNIATTVRWIPSELNSSDEPSRFFSQEESKLLTHLIPVAGNGSHGTKENSELGSSSLRAKEVSSSSERSPEAASKEVRPCQPKRCAGEDHSGARSADDPEPSTLPLHFARCGSLAARSESDESPEDPFSKLHQQHVRKGEDGEEKESKAVSQIGGWGHGQHRPFTFGEECSWSTEPQVLHSRDGGVQDVCYPRGLDLKDPENVDRLLVDYMNGLYLKGFQAYRGDRLAAAMLHFHPQFGKMGAEKLPRMWRALRGFRKLTLGKSRLAYPLMVWAAVASELRRMGKLRMALFLLVSLSSYARPSELIRLQVYSLVRPSPGVTSSWTLLMSPEERPDRTKTGEFDTSIALDSPYMIPWSHTLFGYLKQTHPSNPLWDFDYNQYCRDFQKAVASLGLDLTPYLTRHSGPSIDRSRGYRSQLEVQKRGQWKSQSSVMRYEKAARLAATTENLPALTAGSARKSLGRSCWGPAKFPPT